VESAKKLLVNGLDPVLLWTTFLLNLRKRTPRARPHAAYTGVVPETRLGKFILDKRRELMLPQAQVALEAKIQPTMLSEGESGKRRFTVPQVVRLALVLTINPLQLLRMWFYEERPELHHAMWGRSNPFASEIPSAPPPSPAEMDLLADYRLLSRHKQQTLRRTLRQLLEQPEQDHTPRVLPMRRAR
jgi:transcriptional regulator with XRE-family HTH domain